MYTTPNRLNLTVQRQIKYKTNMPQIGDIIRFTLTDGEEVQAMAVQQVDDGMLFFMVDCLANPIPMSDDKDNTCNYGNSDLRQKLNTEIALRFPPEIRSLMAPLDNGDLLSIPTAQELLFDWKFNRQRRNLLAFWGESGICGSYWLQNHNLLPFGSTFSCISIDGEQNLEFASNPLGVRMVFKLLRGDMTVIRRKKIQPVELLVGDIFDFSLSNGESVQAMAVKQDMDGMMFCFVDCLQVESQANKHSRRVGYEISFLREKLNSVIVNRFPNEIIERMVSFPNGDFLRLPTEKEIFGKNLLSEPENAHIQQWAPMKQQRNRIACKGKDGIGNTGKGYETYWLQNTAQCSPDWFSVVSFDGDICCSNALYSRGIRPVFKLR